MEKKMEHQLHVLDTARPTHKKKETNDGKCLFVVGGICSIGCCRGQACIRRPQKPGSFINLDCFSLSLCLSLFRVHIRKA